MDRKAPKRKLMEEASRGKRSERQTDTWPTAETSQVNCRMACYPLSWAALIHRDQPQSSPGPFAPLSQRASRLARGATASNHSSVAACCAQQVACALPTVLPLLLLLLPLRLQFSGNEAVRGGTACGCQCFATTAGGGR